MTEAQSIHRLRLPDGKELEVDAGSTYHDAALAIGPRLANEAVAVKADAAVLDLHTLVNQDGPIQFLMPGDAEALEVLRHSSAHLMAQAVKRLFPEAKFGVGPVIEHGFFYDMVLSRPLTPDDLEKIEKEMKSIAKENHPVRREVLDRSAALAWADGIDDEFKRELIEDLPDSEELTVYHQGEFTDLCTGPHVPSTKRVRSFKLLSVAGAYWRGDEKRPMMQRIYGTSFFDKKELKAHLEWLEEVKRRDHRKIGKDLDLFLFHSLAPASPFFTPKGAQVYNLLVDYVRDLYVEYGYQEVITPQIFQTDLFKTSGHYDNYKDGMYFVESDGQEYGVKPMNCPGHMLLYASRVHSYREFPLRYADFGRLHRYERSGVIRGLTRVRSFAQDDAHIFLAPEMIADELNRNFEMLARMYRDLEIEFPEILLGTQPEKSVGSQDLWDRAEAILKEALQSRGVPFKVNEGDGAFYGPKIDFVVRDALGREWQLPTFQLDFTLPERFDLKYSAADGSIQRPVVIHRAMLGSLERFIGIYLEHTGGNLPVWLAPVQVKVLSVSTEVADYAEQVGAELVKSGIRATVDGRNEKIGAKIREGTMQRIPYLLVVGGRERDSGSVAIRERSVGDRGALSTAAFLEEIQGRVSDKV